MRKQNDGSAGNCLVAKYIGSDFDHVMNVSENMEAVKHTDEMAAQIKKVLPHVDNIKKVGDGITEVIDVSKHMDTVGDVHKHMDSVQVNAKNINTITAVGKDLHQIEEVVHNLKTIKECIALEPKLDKVIKNEDNIELVGTNIGSVLNVSSNMRDVHSVVAMKANIDAVGSIKDEVAIVGTAIYDVEKVSDGIAKISRVADGFDHITKISPFIDDVATTGIHIKDVVTVSQNMDRILSLSSDIYKVTDPRYAKMLADQGYNIIGASFNNPVLTDDKQLFVHNGKVFSYVGTFPHQVAFITFQPSYYQEHLVNDLMKQFVLIDVKKLDDALEHKVLTDVFGSKPIDLVDGLVITPTNKQYPKLSAFDAVYELIDNSVVYTVKSFSKSSDNECTITLSDDSTVVATKFNPLSLKSLSHTNRTIYVQQPPYNFDSSVKADNTDAWAKLSRDVKSGDTIDFQGAMYRIFAGVEGIAASTAKPDTDDGLEYAKCAVFTEDVTFKNGGVYAADQKISNVKKFYPSTVSFVSCSPTFDNVTFESKGESYGDSDVGKRSNKARRIHICITSGGHAAFFGRCVKVTGTLTGRLCGSVAPLYFSSCKEVALTNPFSNPASLGYAAYAFDAWVGSTAETGFDMFHGTIINPIAYKETLLRREDKVQAGSNVYCGKGGIVTEDTGINVETFGGHIADMYANGGSKTIGYAFGAGVFSRLISYGATVKNCQEVMWSNVSGIGTATCEVYDVDAEVGLTGIMIDKASFGNSDCRLTGKVVVTGSRVWRGASIELSQTSLVASLKTAASCSAYINCNATGKIHTLIVNSEACYGLVEIAGGSYTVSDNFIDSVGWGAASANSIGTGFIVTGKARLICTNDTSKSGIINYTNVSPHNVYTYVNHDFTLLDIVSSSWRGVDTGYKLNTNQALIEKIEFPTYLKTVYSSKLVSKDRATVEYTNGQVSGLSGSSTLVQLTVPTNKTIHKGSLIYLDKFYIARIYAVAQVNTGTDQVLNVKVLIAGDVRSRITEGTFLGVGA